MVPVVGCDVSGHALIRQIQHTYADVHMRLPILSAAGAHFSRQTPRSDFSTKRPHERFHIKTMPAIHTHSGHIRVDCAQLPLLLITFDRSSRVRSANLLLLGDLELRTQQKPYGELNTRFSALCLCARRWMDGLLSE